MVFTAPRAVANPSLSRSARGARKLAETAPPTPGITPATKPDAVPSRPPLRHPETDTSGDLCSGIPRPEESTDHTAGTAKRPENIGIKTKDWFTPELRETTPKTPQRKARGRELNPPESSTRKKMKKRSIKGIMPVRKP